MWMVLQLIRTSVLIFFAAAAIRIATAIARAFYAPPARQSGKFNGRRLLGWTVLLPIAAALISLQFGGFYAFTDSHGGSWSYLGHGWPLGHQFSLMETFNLHRDSEHAIYFAALATNLASLLAILAAVRYVLDRLLTAVEAARAGREAALNAAAGLAAFAVALLIDRWLADPVVIPGTSMLFYTPLAHDLWYCRLPVLVGLSCLLFVFGAWIVRGVKAFFQLREEGVI
jgi:hypothetical protein